MLVDSRGHPIPGGAFAIGGLFFHWIFLFDVRFVPLVAVWCAHLVFLYGWSEAWLGQAKTGRRAGWWAAGLAGSYLLWHALGSGSAATLYALRPTFGYFAWVLAGIVLALAARPECEAVKLSGRSTVPGRTETRGTILWSKEALAAAQSEASPRAKNDP